MNKKKNSWMINIKFRNTIVPLLLISVLISSFYSVNMSYSKYVTSTGPYSLAINSSSTFSITIGAISGAAQVGETLTAGALTPVDATATYQWQKCDTATGTYTDISGAVSLTYTLVPDDYNYYFRVVATGTGSYSGVAISGYTGPAGGQIITEIGAISGTASVGLTLTAGAITPANATVTYQWMRATSATGTYSNISGATASTYTLVSNDYNYYFKVVATGTGYFTGTLTSEYKGPTTTGTVTATDPITGTLIVGQTLTAGAITPANATVTYQWMRATSAAGTYSNVSGATSNTYTLVSGDATYYYKVKVTGNGNFNGTVTSTYVGPIPTPLTAIGSISGTAKVGNTLTTGARTPTAATVTYQWKKCLTSDGTYTDIEGATSSTYLLASADYNYYIKVSATATGNYSGTVTSAPSSKVASSAISSVSISGTRTVGQTLTATTSPTTATVTYQWTKCLTSGGTYVNIDGATSSTYVLTASDYNYYLKVVVVGTGGYTGTKTSSRTTTKVVRCSLTSIGAITGTTTVGQTLTAGAVLPEGAVYTYQWKKCSTSGGIYTNISGATSSTYVLTSAESNYYIKVSVTGVNASGYTGTVTSAASGKVT